MSQLLKDNGSAVTVSVVSHGQIDLLLPLLQQLADISADFPLHVLITQNLPELRPALLENKQFRVQWITNQQPLGFAENHNNAFEHCKTGFFCVLNPDVRLDLSSLVSLRDCVNLRPGVAGPRVVSSAGGVEDSARFVPSATRLLKRWAIRRFLVDYPCQVEEQQVDWLAGMCLMFDRGSYARLKGFNSGFRLYCEDVDICLRCHLAGLSVTWLQRAVVIHDAQRNSRRRWRYLFWHVCSLLKLLHSTTYWRFRIKKQIAQTIT